MPISEDLQKSIEQAVSEEGQPKAVANRLVAWLTELSQRELKKDENSKYLENVRKAIDLEAEKGNDED